MDCDCKDCNVGFWSRTWNWLESDPGPWLSLLPWAFLGAWALYCLI